MLRRALAAGFWPLDGPTRPNMHSNSILEPIYARLFLLYLFYLACFVAVRTSKLAWRLYFFRPHRIPSNDKSDSQSDSIVLARSTLARRTISGERLNIRAAGNAGHPLDAKSKEGSSSTMSAADTEFVFLWEQCYADIKSMKRLASFTLLLSILLFVYGAFPTWSYEFNNANITGSAALVEASIILLKRLSLGVGACTAVYGVSSFLEIVALRRMALWKYLRSRYTD